ncbi:MAG: hypothetical protein EOM72_05870 [Opitutae bacterium]|nr:hypothetical protein [Opitutae bacterium]
MKTNRTMRTVAVAVGLLRLGLAAQAQYAIDWHTMDGGGGTSTGGIYEITGTIGQPDAGATLQGGDVALQGGFWALIGVMQTDGAPELRIANNNNGTATLSWAVAGADGFQLRVATDLVAEDWADVPDVPAVVGSDYQVTVSLTVTKRYYQLRKP